MLVEQLPRESRLMRALVGEPSEWTVDTVLLADLYHAMSGKSHPQRVKVADSVKANKAAEDRQRLLDQRRRARKRGSGE